ncbi:MAG: YkgJ family cysteine cluster protein [Anaerolineaceae bacterium]|nr:MAG: YkgJ family cysteine cluster protein [Anaerolineaceae bacterium]
MTIITDLAQIKQLADQRQDDFAVMGYMLQREQMTDAELDALVDAIAAPIIAAIDCTGCANCCRVLDVYLTPDDAERLQPAVDVPLSQIIEHDAAAQVEEWGMFRARPCRFLRGTLCAVYPHRPETCRTYPALTPDFRWTIADSIAGAAVCPIIYNVLARMVDEAERLSRQSG